MAIGVENILLLSNECWVSHIGEGCRAGILAPWVLLSLGWFPHFPAYGLWFSPAPSNPWGRNMRELKKGNGKTCSQVIPTLHGGKVPFSVGVAAELCAPCWVHLLAWVGASPCAQWEHSSIRGAINQTLQTSSVQDGENTWKWQCKYILRAFIKMQQTRVLKETSVIGSVGGVFFSSVIACFLFKVPNQNTCLSGEEPDECNALSGVHQWAMLAGCCASQLFLCCGGEPCSESEPHWGSFSPWPLLFAAEDLLCTEPSRGTMLVSCGCCSLSWQGGDGGQPPWERQGWNLHSCHCCIFESSNFCNASI